MCPREHISPHKMSITSVSMGKNYSGEMIIKSSIMQTVHHTLWVGPITSFAPTPRFFWFLALILTY